MDVEWLKEKLRGFSADQVTFSKHALEQAEFRGMDVGAIKGDIIDPKKLVFYKDQIDEGKGGKKYNCYFKHSNTHHHRYVLVPNGKILIVTVININRGLQHLFEKGK